MAFDFWSSFEFGGWALLVHLAALTQVIGYLIRDQLFLRILLLIGTVLYIAYYRLYPDAPLWDAIFWGCMLGLANLASIVFIIRDRTGFRMTEQQARLYTSFNRIGPGEFRRLMKIARFEQALGETVLTMEGEVPDRLYYVMSGDIEIEKAGRRFGDQPGTFIGELSFLTHTPASATVRLAGGSVYVSWDRETLARALRRKPGMKQGLDTLMTQDVAAKLQRT